MLTIQAALRRKLFISPVYKVKRVIIWKYR